MMRALLALALLAQVATAWAGTYYVTATGAGAQDGSSLGNAYAGLAAAFAGSFTADDTLCLDGTFTGTANQQVSGIMLRAQVSGSGSVTVYDGDCDGDGTRAVLDCDDAVGIGIRAYNGSAQSTDITVRNIEITQCTNKNIVTYASAGDETNDAQQTWQNIYSHDAGSGAAAGNCFDSRGRNITLDDSTVTDCDEDGVYHKGKYFSSTNLTCANPSRANSNGDCLQLAGEADGYYVSGFDCDHTETDSKQCFIVSALTDTGAGGVLEDSDMRCYPGATTMNCAFVTGDGARVRRIRTTGGNIGIAVEGSATSTNMDIGPVIATGATTANISVANGIGDNVRIGQWIADSGTDRGLSVSSANTTLSIYDGIATDNGGCGIYRGHASQVESHNDSSGNGDDFCVAGVPTSAGTGSMSADPKYIDGATPNTALGFRLKPNSPLIRAGTCYLSPGCVYPDYRGYRGRVPPDIGAYQRN
ncbi:MAG: hypothetical protein KDE20_21960 [Caldilineaceae bacterium]|nr:hypothetical protein [Caldilineaceae bacterium]